MRRAAARADQGPTDEQQSGGSWPLDVIRELYAGVPQDPTNVSFPFLRRMRGDHMISMCLHLIEMGILKSPWYYESNSAQASAFADNLIRPIYGRLVRSILRFLWAGYSPGVKRFKFVSPDWTYIEGGEVKKVWTGPADAAIYRSVLPLKPELCRPNWQGGDFNGIKYDGRYSALDDPLTGRFLVDGFDSQTIDLVHSMWATHGAEGEDNSIFGKSRISYCAPIYHEYWRMWAQISHAFERNADPGPVVRYPKDGSSVQDSDRRIIPPVELALRIGRRRRSGSTTAMPSETWTSFDDRPSTAKMWDIEYPKHETDFERMLGWMGYLEAAKCQAVWMPEQGVVGSSITGSSSNRNVFEGAGDLRDEALYVLMTQIDEFIDNVFVRPAFAMNMPNFEGTIRKRTLGINKDDADIVRQMFQLIGQENWRAFGVDIPKLAEARGLPMLDPAERERQLQQAADQAEKATTPVVEPTQGRRALVTQSGFGDETTYVQYDNFDGPTQMADDGDFVANLPNSDHFSDQAVVASTRRLRKQARTFYVGLYEDFAIYVSKRRTLELAEDGGWASKLVDNWRPRVERTRTFLSRLRSVLSSVFDRAAGLALKDLGSNARVSSASSVRASRWIEQHGLELAESLTETVRDELRTFLVREVKRGATPKDVARALRQEFSEWPDWKSDRVALTEVPRAYNFATLSAGEVAGVKKVQLIDGDEHDDGCRRRDGKIISIKDAFKEDLLHPRCGLMMRLLPQSSLEVRRQPLEGGLLARFDEDTDTVLLSPEIDDEKERSFMKALGERLRVSPNGNHPEESATIESS